MTALTEWDPLIGGEQELGSEYIALMKKLEIRNILKSYTGYYDVFIELIQNALDALDERIELYEENYEPTLWITIDLHNNKICVTDNGIGFEVSKFKHFLSPNVSFKTGRNSRGSKGVGATFLAYGYNYIQIGTKTPDFSYVGNLERGRQWVDDETSSIIRPRIRQATLEDNNFDDIDRGSTFCIKLLGENIRPRDLNWIGATTADQWGSILRIMTPLGGIYFDNDAPNIKCNLTVINRNEEISSITIDECLYLYPHEIVPSVANLREIIEANAELLRQQRPTELPQRYQNLDGIYKWWNKDELLSEIFRRVNLNAEFRDMIERHEINVYGFFCYTTQIWDTFNDDTLNLRSGLRVMKGGFRIASRNMLQGVYLPIPLTRYIGYQNTTHVIVYIDAIEPDLGRKGFQPEHVTLAEEISVNIVNIFRKWAKALKPDTGITPTLSRDLALYNWTREQVVHEASHPLTISGPGLFMPEEELKITSTPLCEQDVIALFHQMITAGLIRGIKIMSTRYDETYDGLYKIEMVEPYERYIYDERENPLGVHSTIFNGGDIKSRPYVLEYKYNVDGLIDDFEREIKDVKDIELVIAWNMGDKWESRYKIIPLLDKQYVHHRHVHGLTHIVNDARTGTFAFYAIILSELINYLNDSENMQSWSRKRYIIEI